jgi:hypothetical protein
MVRVFFYNWDVDWGYRSPFAPSRSYKIEYSTNFVDFCTILTALMLSFYLDVILFCIWNSGTTVPLLVKQSPRTISGRAMVIAARSWREALFVTGGTSKKGLGEV